MLAVFSSFRKNGRVLLISSKESSHRFGRGPTSWQTGTGCTEMTGGPQPAQAGWVTAGSPTGKVTRGLPEPSILASKRLIEPGRTPTAP